MSIYTGNKLAAGSLNPDLYQKSQDSTLQTTAKTVVGAINELNSKIPQHKPTQTTL